LDSESRAGEQISPLRISASFDVAAESQRLTERLRAALVSDLEFGGAEVWKEFGFGEFTLDAEFATSFLAQRMARFTEINEATRHAIEAALTEGQGRGEGFDDLADRVKQIFQAATDSSAEAIAADETSIAVNSGRQHAMQMAGIPHS